MTFRKHATRILALLLAVLLFGQLAAFQLPVSAASAVPAGHDGAAYIPAGADVNDLLSQTLLSNYDEVGSQQWEYRATSILSDYAVKWTPVNGFDTTGSFFRDRLNASYPALNSESAAQSYAVRIEGTSTVYTFTKLAFPAADAAAPSVTPDAAPGADPAVTPNTGTDTAPDAAPSTAADTTEGEPGTYTLNMTYTADGKIDFDALRAAIVATVLPDADAASVTVTYEAKAKISSKITAYVPLKGGWETVGLLPYEFPAITVGTYNVKLTANGQDTIVTVTLKDARTQAKIVLKEGVSLSYTKDAAAMRTQILDKLIDWSQTTVSKEAAAQSIVIEYYGTGSSKHDLLTHDDWYPVEGGTVKFGIDYTAPGIGAGENQQIRASFPTTADYLGCDAVEGTLTVNKAFVRVHVKSASIFYDEKPTTQQYVTTKPEGDFTIFKVYSGVTSNVKGAIYLQLPESILSPEALEKIDPVVKLLCGKTLTDIFNDGMTLGELRELLQQLEKPTDDLAKFLKIFNIDISSFTELLKVVNKIPGVFDSTRVAIGSPNRAGMYLVTAITSNPNYKTGVGTGTLVVKMRATGASLTWDNDRTTYTTGELESSPLGATLMRGDTPAHNQDGVHYRYIGTTDTHRLYISSKAPTEPGTYRQTAYILGGNDMAKSISRSITITAN
ncbi:MAG: hypothetical protein UET87_08320 [Oscillospiraceae bacterium]|nr:hypothetical protein [Oscillospiraceae bacterium]